MPSKQVLTISLETYPQLEEDSQSEPDCDMPDCDEDTLEALNIIPVARLSLPIDDSTKDFDISSITARSQSLGTDAFMSPQRFHEHLQMLYKMVPWTDGSSRTWIDAFFLRAACMVPSSEYMIVCASQAQSPDVYLPLTHCASIFPKDKHLGIAQEIRSIGNGKSHEGFFLAQGRRFMLADDVPRAVYDMYTVAERTKQPVLRGVLTNGCDWIFLILIRNPDGQGATYKESAVISLVGDFFSTLEPWADVIALLLTTWVQRCFTDFNGEEDWLRVSWQA